MKKRTTNPWMSAIDYGHSLPAFTVNLLVRDVAMSAGFYEAVLNGMEHYQDEDFAAMNVGGLEFMLHADHTYGVELRLLGLDPDRVEALARHNGAVLIAPATDKPHGWRETMVQDPDGYIWAVGVKID